MKIDKIALRKNQESFSFIIVIFLLLGGYLFFFTSTLWMPPSADASYLTKLGTEVAWDERTVIINRWDYSEKQNEMEETAKSDVTLELAVTWTDEVLAKFREEALC